MAGSDFCIMAPIPAEVDGLDMTGVSIDYTYIAGASDGVDVSGAVTVDLSGTYPWPALMSEHADWSDTVGYDITPTWDAIKSAVLADIGGNKSTGSDFYTEYKWSGNAASALSSGAVMGWESRCGATGTSAGERLDFGPLSTAYRSILGAAGYFFLDGESPDDLPLHDRSPRHWWSTLNPWGWTLEPLTTVSRRQSVSPYDPASGITTITHGVRRRYELTAQWCPAARTFLDRLEGWPASGWAAQASRVVGGGGPDQNACWDQFWEEAARGGVLIFSTTDPDAEPRLLVLTGGSELAQTYDRTVTSGRWYDIVAEFDLVGTLSDITS